MDFLLNNLNLIIITPFLVAGSMAVLIARPR